MVKLGFIVEGDTEKFILEKSDFFDYLKSLGIEFVPEVINAKGNGNLLPHNISESSEYLEDNGATVIIILTDLDTDQCITKTKERISPIANQIVVISVKEIEAWFLSDSTAMSRLLKQNFVSDNPESIENPFEEIQSICIKTIQRGIGTKTRFANNFVRNHKFSILNAAQHPDCNSAKYFLKKIKELRK